MKVKRWKNCFLSLGVVLMFMFILGANWQETRGGDQEEVQEEEVVQPESVKKMVPKVKGYTYNLEQLVRQIKENINKVDQEIRDVDLRQQYFQEKENEIRDYFEKGNALYEEGQLREAKEYWQQALILAQDPEMQAYMKRMSRLSER